MRFAAALLAVLTVAGHVTGQPLDEEIDITNACSYDGNLSPSRVLPFASDDEAREAVKRIVDASGLTQNFQIRAAGVNNAAAAFDTEARVRYLLYNQRFMQDMKRATGTEWAAMSVLAHEIGHHLNNHTLEPKRDLKFEIEADYFSGFILRNLGATLAESQSALNYLPGNSGSSSHPPKHDRLAAVANGWTKACERDPSCGKPAPAVAVSDKPKSAPARAEAGPDSCKYARDGECDEPDLCERGTDSSDCKPRSRGPNSCEYSHDGTCDDPGLCPKGTDTADCNQPQSILFCCDAWGRRWCQIVANPGPPGTPCWCAGVPGSGVICL